MLGVRVKKILSFGLQLRKTMREFLKKLKRKSSNGLHFYVELLTNMNKIISGVSTPKKIQCRMKKMEKINKKNHHFKASLTAILLSLKMNILLKHAKKDYLACY